MNHAYALLEPSLVGLIVLASALAALRHLAPRQLGQLAAKARAVGLPAWVGTLMTQPVANAGDCAAGCGSCHACGPTPSQPQPVILVPRRKPAANG